nr:MAG TPA: hypothetical protein [Caudoviricetes sp.]
MIISVLRLVCCKKKNKFYLINCGYLWLSMVIL